jgi:hypothetical protein
MSKKHTYEHVRNVFEGRGYKLISDRYDNDRQKLEYICPNGHRHSIEYRHFQSGHGCLKCVGTDNSKRFRMDINIVKSSFEQSNYLLLTNEYINAHQQLHYICSAGHEHFMTWNNWSKGYRCPICDIVSRAGDGHWNWKGGISCEPYCDIWTDKEYKRSIMERDNYTCQNPECSGKFTDKLCLHHIDYNKKNCHPTNLITLCISCNSKANGSREHWKEFYGKGGFIND